MKLILAFALLSTLSIAAPTGSKRTAPMPKQNPAVHAKTAQKNKGPNALDKKAEDCDEKAKKPVEITTESISLSGGNTGCSLDEAKP